MKKIMKKMYAVVLVMALLATLIGCANSGSGEEGGTEENPTLVCWHILNPESDADPRNTALKEIVDEWNANNEYGATMEVVSVTWEDIGSQLTQAAAAGNSPDVVCAFSAYLDQYIAAGALQPMTEYATEWIGENPEYIFSADSITKEDGEIYSLPWETRVMTMYYRSDIFGEELPYNSLEDIVDVAAEYSGNGTYGYLFGFYADSDFLQQLTPILYAFGGGVYDEDMNIIINTEEGKGVEAIEWLRDLYNAGVLDDAALQMNFEDVFDAMKAGQAYSIVLGTHRYGALTSTEDIGQYIKTAAIPGAQGGTAAAYDTSQTLGIGADCEYPEIAFDFIAANCTTEASAKYYDASCMPVRTDVYDLESVQQSEMYDVMSQWSETWETGFDNLIFEPDYNEELSIALAEAVQDMLVNGTDIQAGLDEVVARFQD